MTATRFLQTVTLIIPLFLFNDGKHVFGGGSPRGLPHGDPREIGLRPDRLELIDSKVLDSIAAGELPGAVVVVGRHGRIGYFKAFGNRAILPQAEPMTTDVIFDVASLTKVMATTPAVLMLVESGKIRLADRVKRYLPKFVGGGKDNITVRQLMTHYSGLRPDFDLAKNWHGYEATLEELWLESTQAEPGKEFIYSDLNFITLGEIVRAVSGRTLDAFLADNLYGPLGMSDTGFNPPQSLHVRIAPTETRARSLAYLNGKPNAGSDSDTILKGEVHDPTAWRMGGVAGHAGLFSSAHDIAIYAQMILNQGIYEGKRTLAPMTVRAMSSPQSPRLSLAVRGFGWDVETSYSSPRGDLFGTGFGHTGFTGTSLWIHPESQTFVILLSNRVHPAGKGDVTHLRGALANIVASAIVDRD